MNLPEIAEVWAKCELEPEQIDNFCLETGITRQQFFDDIARYIAQGYAHHNLSFEFCDTVINEVWRISEFNLSSFCYSVYEAFDQGEYYHPNDSQEITPDELHTRPMINRILANE